MAVSTRESLKQYALRALGAPVLEINVDEDQLEDRIDEALEYWRLYHAEGIETVYLKEIITPSVITIQESIAEGFSVGETITGVTSGATAEVVREEQYSSSGTTLYVYKVKGTFVAGETIIGSISATLSDTDPITIGVWDNKYISVSDLVYGVVRVLPYSQASSSKNMFDLQYQLRLHDLYDVASTSMIYYKTVMNHISLLDFELNAKPDIRFNRLTNKLYLDINWGNGAYSGVRLGDYLIVECYRVLDPTDAPRMYNELWLKHYVTALFKRQWATNIKKFSGIQLPGGVTLDGDSLYREATDEIKDLEDELMSKSAPLQMFLG